MVLMTADDETKPRRVLIVEDDDGLRNLIQKALRKAGYDVDSVATGAAALERVMADPGLALLLDQKLPDMAGSDIIQTFNERGLQIPFIVMTGHGDERLAVEMMKLGAVDYLVKTLDMVDLLPGLLQRMFRELDNERQLLATEAKLRESEERFKLSMEATRDGLWDWNIKTDETYFSPGYYRMLGYEVSAFPGKGNAWKDLIHPDDREHALRANMDCIEGRRDLFEVEYRMKAKNGAWRWILGRGKCIARDEQGRALRLVGTHLDITERKQGEEEKHILEERLQRSEKMEALGLLAGGVAHDLNNVLGIVVGYAELILMNADESSPIRPHLVNIMSGGMKAAAIVDDLLTLARRGVADSEIVNLNKIIVACQKSTEFEKLYSYHPAVKVKADIDPDLPNIAGSSVHLVKSLYNLVANASEAMAKGGVVTIKTTSQYLEQPLQGYDEVRVGDYVVLAVSDTGEGIPAANLKRIFEPFYTKKVMGRSGTGLGLAVVWGTVKDHHGYINVQSEEGKGSTFTLYFPVTQEDITAEGVEVAIAEYLGKGESILIVDDVKEQRDLAAGMLGALNYNVASVASGEEAEAYLKRHQADLMVLDMIMDPGMDGLDTYRSIIKIRPKQKAIIVSGFSESERVKTAKGLGAGAYVKKPYIKEKLGLAVRKELDRST